METWQIYMLIAYAICLTGQLADSVTTEASLARGAKETNRIAVAIISKVGVSGLSILKCGVVPMLGIPFYLVAGWQGFAAYEIPTGIAGLVCGAINVQRMRKAGQPIL